MGGMGLPAPGGALVGGGLTGMGVGFNGSIFFLKLLKQL